MRDYEQSVFQDLDGFLRTIRIKEDDINFILQKFNSNFET